MSRRILILLMFPVLSLASDLEGPLSGYLPAGTYTIVDDIEVPSGQTLTLAAGVVFEFDEGYWTEYEFDVWGTLIAEGTAGNPIRFRAASGVSEYNYIRLASSSSVLRHCEIENAGRAGDLDEGGLWIDNSSPLIENCRIHDCYWHGVYVTGSSACPTFRNTESYSNDVDGFDAADNAGMHLENCIARDNGEDGICFSSGDNRAVGCLVYGNDEDGFDCYGVIDNHAVLINCTVAANGSDELADCGDFQLYNCLVVQNIDDIGSDTHCLFTEDLSFFGFVDPASSNYRLQSDSPAVSFGNRFGAVSDALPAFDLDGNPRITGILDAGAHESSWPVDPGTDGTHFSRNLLSPRLAQPALRERAESFEARIGLMGSFSPADCSAQIINPIGETFDLTVSAVQAGDLEPGSDLALMLHAPGLETIQTIDLAIPADTPPDFYDLQITLGGNPYFATKALRVYDSYPDSWGFLHITDTHIGHDSDEYTALERLHYFVEEANFLNPELVVVTGDICDNQHMDHNLPADFMNGVAGLQVPVYVIAGNHDHYTRDSAFHPGGQLRYFHEINRYCNSIVEFGGARFYGLNTGHDMGLDELYRCRGPLDEVLDWVEADLSSLDAEDTPRFLLMHGPNYDYFMWNTNNTLVVRDMMNAHDFGLGLAGHTHRYETFRNEGENSLGRNDYYNDDDWERDQPFPGYPLHLQTSSLGVEESPVLRIADSLSASAAPEAQRTADLLRDLELPATRGIFGDNICWRWVQVDGGDVSFFTADDDGDGYRNTEAAWPLGDLSFAFSDEEGVLTSSVENHHHESWHQVLHYVPAAAGTDYLVEGGTLLRRLQDGTAIVEVAELGAQSVSTVVLTPSGTWVPALPTALKLLPNYPNPFNPKTEIRYELGEACPLTIRIYDASGRLLRILLESSREAAGSGSVVWNGRDNLGRELPSGVYLCRVRAGSDHESQRLVLLK